MAVKSIEDQIKDLENTRAAKAARNQKITQKAADEGRSMDEGEQEEFDTNADAIDMLDGDLARLQRLQKQLGGARQVTQKAGERREMASVAREPRVEAVQRKEQPGLAFARVVKCLGRARGNWMQAEAIAKNLYGDNDPAVGFIKGTVAAGSSASSNWGEKLIGEETSAFADFVEWLRPQTILGKFGSNGVPALRQVPFRVPLISQTAGGEGYWVGEGKPKPLTNFGFDRTTIAPLKVANIVVLTEEHIRDSSPSSDMIVRDQMAAALRERLDRDFIDPLKASGTPPNSPSSITYQVQANNSSGNTANHVREDVKALFAGYIAANNPPTNGVWIMPATTALSLSLMTNALGAPEFPGITMNGGTFFGMPVIASEYVPTVTAGAYVFLVNASDIYFADEGDITIDVSREASLEMLDSALVQDQPTGTSLVSLWQNNLVGFLAERTINWSKRRPEAVAALDEVNWGSLVT